MPWPDRRSLACLLLLCVGLAQAESSENTAKLKLSKQINPDTPEEELAPPTLMQRLRHCNDGTDRSDGWLRHLTREDQAQTPRRFGQPCDVDWHKPIFILPYSYSRDYESSQTEVLFAVSAKLRPLGPPLYFAYSQRSFWSLYDAERSRPFRETVFNPEVFYRWIPKSATQELNWGLDGGYEHESNGQDIPESRSWDRLYIAPFIERGGTALQAKFLFRYNPATGYGALRIEHLDRLGDGDLFWNVYLWHGYGESLTDYNDSVTRIGVGFALSP